jgi:hypothetical protein
MPRFVMSSILDGDTGRSKDVNHENQTLSSSAIRSFSCLLDGAHLARPVSFPGGGLKVFEGDDVFDPGDGVGLGIQDLGFPTILLAHFGPPCFPPVGSGVTWFGA